MTLELLICTNKGLQAVEEMLLPEMDNVRYLVASQCSNLIDLAIPLPQSLAQRSDVRILRYKGEGLSMNRNVALSHATGDILLIADDDCRYTPQQLQAVLQAYDDHPEADIITFRMDDMDGKPHKNYPEKPFEWTLVPKGYYVSSWEISFRRNALLPRFDEHFGIGGGSYFGCAEEEVWMHDATHGPHKFRALYLPLTIGSTPSGTTGTHFLEEPSIQRAKGAMLRLSHTAKDAWPRIVKAAWTAPVCLVNKWRIFCHMAQGAREICRLRKL